MILCLLKQEIIKIHTWKDPYPKIHFKVNEIPNQIDDLIPHYKNKLIKENLTCYITKLNIFDDRSSYYFRISNSYKSSNIFYPIPEILSYEGYLAQVSLIIKKKIIYLKMIEKPWKCK